MRNAVWVIPLMIAAAADVRANDDPWVLDSLSRSSADLGLPSTLGDSFESDAPPPAQADDKEPVRHQTDRPEFTIGPMAGYLNARGADRGTWFGGMQARLRFLRIFAVEGSLSFHQNQYSDGDVVVTQYPVQVSALILPFTAGPFDPYVLAGAGWYYSRIDYDDSIGGGSDTDSLFGFHVGAGTNLWLSSRFSLFSDFRWIFLDEPGVDNSTIKNEEFDYWQLTFGMNFGF